MPHSLDRLQRDVRFLRAYAGASLIAFGLLALAGFRQPRATKFAEIDVERINIVEKDGRLRLAISNSERSSGPIERGKPFGYPGGGRPGMIFFNEEGTENGGLTFSGKRDSTGKYEAVGSLTFDQYEQDQTIALQYVDSDGRRRAGLQINDYALGVSSAALDRRMKAARAMRDSASRADSLGVLRAYFARERLYAGRTRDGSAQLILSDAAGRPRLRFRVDSLGVAKIDFLNDSGRVVRSLNDR